MGSARRDLGSLPEDVKDVFGSALLDVQFGDTPDAARPFGEGLPAEIMKLVENFHGDTYRLAYTAAYPRAVYVLDAFKKKSVKGIRTPRINKDRVLARFKLARAHYKEHYGDA